MKTRRYARSLYDYTRKGDTKENLAPISHESEVQIPEGNATTPNVDQSAKAVMPFEPNVSKSNTQMTQTQGSNSNNSLVQNNQLRHAPVMFQGATFTNCQITLT